MLENKSWLNGIWSDDSYPIKITWWICDGIPLSLSLSSWINQSFTVRIVPETEGIEENKIITHSPMEKEVNDRIHKEFNEKSVKVLKSKEGKQQASNSQI